MAGPRADRPAWQAESGNQLMLWALPQFPGAVFMRALNLSGLNSREILSSTSGGPKSELQGSTKLLFSKAAREGRVQGIRWSLGLMAPKLLFSRGGLPVCLSFPLSLRSPVVGLGPSLMTSC